MGRVGIIINANARKNRKSPGLDARLRASLGSEGEVVLTRSLDELGPALRRLLDRGAEVLVASGGDGALHRMANELLAMQEAGELAELPPLVPTNGGTIDFVAKKVGVGGDAEAIVARLVAALRGGALPVREVESLELRGVERVGGEERTFRRVGFALAAGGVGQRFFEQYYALEDPGPAAIVGVVARAAPAHAALTLRLPAPAGLRRAEQIFAKTPARVRVDGREVPAAAHGALHAGAFDVDLGGVFRVFPLAAAPGRLHFHAGDVGPWGIIRSLPRMVAGKTLRAEGLVEKAGEEMLIEATEGPLSPVVDGECYEGVLRLEVRPGPRIAIGAP